jgi:hypothetical protein
VVPRLACPSWRWMMLSGTPFAGELKRVRVTQLMRHEPSPDARPSRDVPELVPDGSARPRSPARGAVDDAEQRPDRRSARAAS